MKTALILLFLTLNIDAKTLVFLDNSVSNDTYIASNKERQIKYAFELAMKEINQKCDLQKQMIIGKADPLTIFNQATSINKLEAEKVIIGLIHSSEALLAAKAFEKSNTIILSSGAASDNLQKMNSNFFSIANPVESISEHVNNFIKKKKINRIIAIIPGNSSYSIELAKSLSSLLMKKGISIHTEYIDTSKNHEPKIKELLKQKDYQFIYVPGFIQQTLPIFESISKSDYKGIVYGSANLARSQSDLKLFSNSLNIKQLNIFFPATWMSKETKSSQQLEEKFKKETSEDIMGTAVYTYDAAIIAGYYLCQNKSSINRNTFIDFIKRKILVSNAPTIRSYSALSNGHLISSIHTVKFNFVNNELEKE